MLHVPVLAGEIASAFAKVKSGLFVDCTVGFGGHTKILALARPDLDFFCIDRDAAALEYSKKALAGLPNKFEFFHGNFADGLARLSGAGVIGVLADLGVSSVQLDVKERGFGFDSPVLDMRMDKSQDLSAYDVVNFYTQERLEEVLRRGEERSYKAIAKEIVARRKQAPFSSCADLAQIIHALKGPRAGNKNSATLTFQALRMEVNGELLILEQMLGRLEKMDLQECLVGIISFHSLEDGIVKRYFKRWASECICPADAPRCTCGKAHKKGDIITKKPITPSHAEVKANARSSSSKLRIFEFGRKI
ncbi:MAG: 16S rRNA (cytosine(1402)-N(4))-methyltransferase RsmH [Helicobacteraceae bacterium]